MANTFYSLAAPAQTLGNTRSDWTVGSSSVGGTVMFEVNIENGTLSARQVVAALKKLARLFETRDAQVIPGGTVL